jgi:hypothetical protein
MGNSAEASGPSEGGAQRLGKYELLGEVARGGQGVVHRALDPDSGREVAVKTLISGTDEAQRRRFLREVDALSRLRHPGVVTIFDAGEERGQLWYSMPLLEGQSLEKLVEREALGVEEVIRVGRELCAALGALHEGGCIHRDVKPANVLLCEGRPVLVDFGLTKDLEVEETLALSRTGAVLGTPGYLSPEQAAGKPAGIPTDIYGLGATLYAALTGRPPIDGSSFLEVVVATRERAPDLPSSLRDDVPGALEDVILRCLAKEPGDRYPDMASLLQALEGAEEADVRSRTPLAVVFGGALLLLVVASLALALGLGSLGSSAASSEQSELTQALVAALPTDATDFLPDPGLMLRCQPFLGTKGLPRTDVPPDLARALTRYRFEIATLRGESTEPILERLRSLGSPAGPLLTCRAIRASGGSTDDGTLAGLKRLARGASPFAPTALSLLVQVLRERDPALAKIWAGRLEESEKRRALEELELWELLHADRHLALKGYLYEAGDSAQKLLPRALRWEEARIFTFAASSPLPYSELVAALRSLGILRRAAHAPYARSPLTEAVLAGVVGQNPDASFDTESLPPVLHVLNALGATGLRLADPRGAGTILLERLAPLLVSGVSESWGQVLGAYLRLDAELGPGHLNRVLKPTDSDPLSRALFLRAEIILGDGGEEELQLSAELRSLLRTGQRCPGLGPVNRAACLLGGLKGASLRDSSEITAEAVRLDPGNPWAHLQVGAQAWAEGEVGAALGAAEAAISAFERGRYSERGTVWRQRINSFFGDAARLYGYCGARERAEKLFDSLKLVVGIDMERLRSRFEDAFKAGRRRR